MEPAPAPAYVEDRPTGIGMLVTGPLVVGVGVPLTFLGNRAWRTNCGPSNTNAQCARGSTLSLLSHTGAGLAFTGGSIFTGLGARRLGMSNAHHKFDTGVRPHQRTGAVVAGAILLPLSIIGFGTTRLAYWIPTPECETAACVRNLQTQSSAIVSSFAMTAAIGSGLLMYGMGFNKVVRQRGGGMATKDRKVELAFSPYGSQDGAGLSLGGAF